jgi:ABC-type glycerol-3-phosphate transport system substrate-binding protein
VFQPAILDTVKGAEGGVYGFPTFAYSQGIAYHIPALEAAGYEGPPDTWTELPEMAAALTDRDAGLSGFAMNMAGGGGGWHFTNVAYGFGADLVKIDEDGNYIATYGEGPAVDAMQLIYDLRWKYDALPYDLESNPILLLVADQAAIAMNPGDGLGWVNINMPDVDMKQFGYAPVPAGPDGKRYALIGGSVTMINSAATEDEQEAAFVYQMWRQLSEEEFVPSRKIHHMGQAGQGAPVLTIYQGAFQEMVDEVDAEFVTMPVENYQAYYDALNSGEVVLVPEPAAAQDFYVAIAEVLTEVLTDENADVAALMKTSAEEFQAGVLDFIE